MTNESISQNSVMSTVTRFYDEDSLTERVSSILNFKNVVQLDETGLGFITHNRIFACDLLSGKAQLRLKFKNSIEHIEEVPRKTKQLGIKVHAELKKAKIDRNLNKYLQSAYIGHTIGKVIGEREDLSIRESFEHFVSTEYRNLEIKNFANANELMQIAFPDQSFEDEVTCYWLSYI